MPRYPHKAPALPVTAFNLLHVKVSRGQLLYRNAFQDEYWDYGIASWEI